MTTVATQGPLVRKYIEKRFRKDNADLSELRVGQRIFENALGIIEKAWLAKHDFIVDDALSLADILCFEEVMQVKLWPFLYPNIKLEAEYPNISKWMQRMEALPQYDEFHGKKLDRFTAFMRKRVEQCKPFLSKL